MSELSIIIPCYNDAKVLRDTVDKLHDTVTHGFLERRDAACGRRKHGRDARSRQGLDRP